LRNVLTKNTATPATNAALRTAARRLDG